MEVDNSAPRSAHSASNESDSEESSDLEFDNFDSDDDADVVTSAAFLQDQKEQWDDPWTDEQIRSHYQQFVPQTGHGHKFIDPEAKKIVIEFLPLFYDLLVEDN